MKKIKSILFIAITISLICSLSYIYFFKIFQVQKHVIQDSTVVLEKINNVLKLVTVEGNFSEIFKHEEFYGYNISPLRKIALIRVKAKVLIGYDLEKINMEIDEKSRTIHVDFFPKPEILSLEDEIEYYDISEGLFTSFSPEDYNSLQKIAKNKIREVAKESNLLHRAEMQKAELFSILNLTLRDLGWNLKENLTVVKNKD